MDYHVINSQLTQPLFSSFDDMSKALLGDGQLNQQTVIALGLRCENFSQAFAIGYRCALQALLPQLNTQQWAAMCVSESEGNHPRNITTELHLNGTVSGNKSFVTMASLAKQLVVIAKQGENESHPILKAVLVDSGQPQVNIESFPPLKMVKHVPHGKVEFCEAIGEVLDGDGYLDFNKTFRTLEDIHVTLAASAFILSHSVRNKLAESLLIQSTALTAQLSNMALSPSPWVHIELAHCLDQFNELQQGFSAEIKSYNTEFLAEWEQDRRLFSLSQGARDRRLKTAVAQIYSVRGGVSS